MGAVPLFFERFPVNQACILTRRRLLGTAAAAAVVSPVVQAKTGESSWSQTAAKAAETPLKAVLEHPFVRGMADGSLDRDKFAFYQAQNVHYLRAYAQSLDGMARRLEAAQDVAQMLAWRDETVAAAEESLKLWKSFGKGDKLPDPVAACEFYRSFEARMVAGGSLIEAWAALLPCFWVYDRMGTEVKRIRRLAGNPYADWVQYYGDPAYSTTVGKAVDLAERLAAKSSEVERELAIRAFVTSVRLEWVLFDAAWNKTDWPV